jgi:23S rRNA-/tRNA-specific pseudouridylate synthase
LEVRPKTGRTHQIRVHLKSISHPVVCDKLYSTKKCEPESCLGFNRLALHAFSISLKLPNNTNLVIESPLPKEFEEAKKFLS